MAQDNDHMKYFLNTYSQFSHNHVIAILSSNDAQYRYDMLGNEELYSRFQVMSGMNVYNIIKELIEENNGTAITIEYGSY